MEIIEKRSVKNVTMARRWGLNGQLFGMVVSNLAGVMRGVSCWEQANNGSPTKPPSHESFPQIKQPFEGCSCSPCLGKYFDIGVAEWPKWSSFKHRVWNRKWPQFCLANRRFVGNAAIYAIYPLQIFLKFDIQLNFEI